MREFKDISLLEAREKLGSLKKEYMDIRFKSVVAHLENSLKKRTLRRSIARLNTIISEYEKGIRKA